MEELEQPENLYRNASKKTADPLNNYQILTYMIQVQNERFPPFLSLKEAANFLSVSRETVVRRVKSGKLSCLRLGRLRRFRKDDLVRLLKEESHL